MPVFHTSASSRSIRIGNVTVRMIHTSNRRRLQCVGETAGLALSALRYLGKDNVTPETVATIESAIGADNLRRTHMPIDVQRTTRSHSLKLIASIALAVMAFTGLTSCGGGGGGSGSGSGNQVTIMPLPSPGESLLQGQPDLVVASPWVSAGSPAAGAAFRLSATVSNTGDVESPATTLRFYRSTDATITTADTAVGTDPLDPLSPSGAIAQSISLTAPPSPGTYYYGACVDAVTGESDTTTNNCSGSVQVTVPETQQQGVPDLVVASPSVSPVSPAAGAAFRLSATVSNTGDVESPATTLRFYRSTDATITTADTVVGTDPVGARAAAGTIAQSISLTAPSSPGTYYYGACVDAVTGESDTTTNNCSGSVQVTVPETQQQQRQGAPDLVVASPSVSADSPAAGAAFTLSATVRNDGNGASPATTLRFYRSTDATITTADTVVGTDPVSALAAAGTIAQSISLTAPSSPGTYYYGACVDAVTGESDTTNNCSSSIAVTVLITQQQQGVPDLVVASPSVSDDSPAAGAAFTLSATVRNDGDGDAAATTLRYYQSTDATITTADTVVGTDAVSALAAAGTIAQSISLTAPSSPGAYYYGACVDAVTDESDTTNNCSSSIEVTVLVTQQQIQRQPDLEVGTPTVSDDSPATGTPLTLSATVRNDGNGASPATTLRYYRSTDATITTEDTAVGTDPVGALAAAGTIAQSISLTAPSSPGTYYYGACVDAVTDESDPTNNCSSAVTVTVTVTAPPPAPDRNTPDLVVLSPRVSNDSPAAGTAFTFSATVRNAGSFRATRTTLRFYRSTNATISTADTAVGTAAVGALAAQGTSSESIALTAPSSPGTYYYGACVAAVTGESDTTNNCSSSIAVTVLITQQQQGVPDLVVASPSVSDDIPAAGAAFTLSATVRNDGDGDAAATTLRYYQSPDATITTEDTVVGTDAVGALAAQGTIAQSISLTAPSIPGPYYYGACVAAVTDESDTTNNCSSSIAVTVLITQQQQGVPDLVVASPSVSDDIPAAGAAFTLSVTVRNDGDGDAAATTLRYYQSTDATITTEDTVVGTDAVGALAAQGTIAESISLTAPSSPGPYYYGACVAAVTDESDTTNNCSSSIAVTVLVTQQQQQGVPDLVVASPSVSDDIPAAGAAFTLSATVRNDGDGDAAATTLRYYQSPDATITTEDTVVGTDAVRALAAQETIAESISLTAPSSPGPYYYGACVAAVTDESDTTNNCSSPIAVTVLVTQQQQGVPDLVVASPSVSDDIPAAGAAFTLSATVRNHGDGDAAATTLRYYQSPDATITTEDTVVGTDAVGALAAQETIAESISLTAPSSPGPYYYGACVAAVTDESDTTNNCSSSIAVTVLITQQQQQGVPDLVPVSLSITSNTPETGESNYLFATVTNTGDGESPATTLRYYRSPDATITTEDTVVGTDAVRALAAAGSLRRATKVTAPSSPGTYYYGACVDAVTGEPDTNNNCSPAITVTVRVAGPVPVPITSQGPGPGPVRGTPPDLVVLSPGVSNDSPAAGTAFTFSATVRNAGGYWATRTTLRFYRSTDATITTYDTELGTYSVRSLLVGMTYHATGLLTAPTSVRTYYYGACVDAVYKEGDTTNNCSSGVRVQVGVEQTQPENNPWANVGVKVVVSTTVAPGETFSMSVKLSPGYVALPATTLRLYRSPDRTITRSDTEVGTIAMEAFESSRSAWRRKSTTLTAPGTTGEWYYGACVDEATGDPDSTIACSTGGPFTFVRTAIVGASDLVVSEMRSRGGTLVARVRNDGTGESFPTRLWFYRSSDAAISASNDKRLDSSWLVHPVQPNTTYYRDLTYTFPEPQPEPGIYYYWACVAAPRGETDTTNNCSSSAVEVEHRSPTAIFGLYDTAPKRGTQ